MVTNRATQLPYRNMYAKTLGDIGNIFYELAQVVSIIGLKFRKYAIYRINKGSVNINGLGFLGLAQ